MHEGRKNRIKRYKRGVQSVLRGVQKTEMKEGQKVSIGPGETEPGRLEWVLGRVRIGLNKSRPLI